MTLNEWLWANKMTVFNFCNRYNLQYQPVLNVAQGKKSPKLKLAFRLHHCTRGEVDLMNMLRKDELGELSSFLGKVEING